MISFVCFFVCFVALRPKSTAIVIAGWSVHLTTYFPGQAQAWQARDRHVQPEHRCLTNEGLLANSLH